RTPDPLVPNQMRYQAALFTDNVLLGTSFTKGRPLVPLLFLKSVMRYQAALFTDNVLLGSSFTKGRPLVPLYS
ncbi:hypothetical protein, partial [Vibrio sonorensis]|uniref:hypothetical protein n=1 Tax=Vibrio sonorensis TaxID=1004316 RepID=UPI001C3057D0